MLTAKKKQTKIDKLANFLRPSSPVKGLLIFPIVFALTGGSFAVLKSFAATPPPVNTVRPVVTGSPVVGQVLSATTGTWTGSPTSYAYQWQDCAGYFCFNLAGGSGSRYTVTKADVGLVIRVEVVASNSFSFASSASSPTAVVSVVKDSFTKYVIDASPAGTVVEKTLVDLNGDGKADAVIGEEPSPSQPGGGGIYWYQYPASGIPSDVWTKHMIISSGTAYEDLKAYDVNNDGRQDIIASLNNNVYLFINPTTVNGVWQKVLIGPGNGEDTIALGDIDGDGKTDIATNSYIYFQNSPTSWQTIRLSTSFSASALLDSGSGKGRIDLVGNGASSPYNIVWYQNPRDVGGNARTGTWTMFTVGPGYFCSGGLNQCDEGSVATASTADLNGDGRMDVVVGQSEGSPAPPGGLKWFEAPLNRTQPWIVHNINTSYTDTHNIIVADINRDGTPDLVTGEQDQSVNKRISVFYNDGRGNFNEQVLSHDATHNVAVADVNKDGDLDILSSPHGYFGGPHPIELFVNNHF